MRLCSSFHDTRRGREGAEGGSVEIGSLDMGEGSFTAVCVTDHFGAKGLSKHCQLSRLLTCSYK